MTDTLKKAKDLIERFDGKLRDWTTVGDDEHRTVRIDDFKVPTIEIEYEYITKCRGYITIIKELVGMLDEINEQGETTRSNTMTDEIERVRWAVSPRRVMIAHMIFSIKNAIEKALKKNEDTFTVLVMGDTRADMEQHIEMLQKVMDDLGTEIFAKSQFRSRPLIQFKHENKQFTFYYALRGNKEENEETSAKLRGITFDFFIEV